MHGKPSQTLMVGISLHLPTDMLEKIQKLEGKSQSEKLRKCIEVGYQAILNNGESGEPPSQPLTIPQKR